MNLKAASSLLLTLPTLHAASPDCGTASYTGFALKSNSACKSYVYCQSGQVTSETNCPDGLLFNGGVGRGGICTWPEMVVCDHDDDAEAAADAVESTSSSSTTAAATTTSSSASASASSLPEPWRQYYDDKTGKYYYHNEETGVTQWERPGECCFVVLTYAAVCSLPL